MQETSPEDLPLPAVSGYHQSQRKECGFLPGPASPDSCPAAHLRAGGYPSRQQENTGAAVIRICTMAFLAVLPGIAHAADNPAIEAMREYMEFAEYSEGAISPEQIAGEDLSQFHIVDTRNAGQYDAGHIPGAVNIEWRQILARRNELPTDKTILLYCETGLLSSKAHFALRVAGYDNVKVLWGGYIIWSARQDFDKAQAQTGIPVGRQ